MYIWISQTNIVKKERYQFENGNDFYSVALSNIIEASNFYFFETFFSDEHFIK